MIRYLPDNLILNQLICFGLSCYYTLYESFRVFTTRIVTQSNKNSLKITPLISILIPTYNRGDILKERAIKSVLQQTYLNFEVIIIDDDSNDGTFKTVSEVSDPRIKYVKIKRDKYRYPNKAIYHWFAGPVEALNVGLRLVKGSWIARIDDDDNWTPDHLEKLINFALKENFEFVSSDIQIRGHQGIELVSGFDDPRDPTGIGATQTWLYKAEFAFFKYNINCWRKSYFRVNDTDLQHRMWRAGLKIGYLDEVTAYIEPRPDETLVGSQAYIQNSAKYEKFYSQK